MWTLPNLLTMARIAVIPMIILLIWPGIEGRHTSFWAMVLYALAGLTDIIDGAVARRRNQVTVLGKFLDPLSDKLIYLVTLVALLQLPEPRVPAWIVMIILTRELAITGLRGIAVSEGIVIAAGEGGKLKTLVGTLGMCGLLVHYKYLINFGLLSTTIDFHVAGLALTYLSVVFSLVSGFEYIRGFAVAVRQPRPQS